jgi:DNA replication protein DnaC
MIITLKNDLKTIRCHHTSKSLERILAYSKDNDLSYLEFLRKVVDNEQLCRKEARIKRNSRKAHLPCEKLIESFDFKFQTSITKRQVNCWLDFDWLDNRENKMFIGPSGVGKTHLAIGLCCEALLKGYKVRYYSMCALVEEMIYKDASNSYKEWFKELLKNDLIVLDELGYLPIDNRYTHLFFRLINECYEYRSLLITSNKIPDQWGAYFGDEVVAMAILDRLMHHCEIVVIRGDSYRLKDKLDILGQAGGRFSVGASSLRSEAPTEKA